MDIDALLKGRKYTDLKENYVIFICMFDPFGEDLPVYFFENTCREKSSLKLGDKSFKVCYNVNAFEKSNNEKVKAFLEYVKTQNAKDDFTQRLDGVVRRMKSSNAVQREFMMRNIFADDWFDRGVAVGVAQGRNEGITIGEKRGISQGAHDARVETARKAVSMGLQQDTIIQLTGLSLAEVQSLAETISNVK